MSHAISHAARALTRSGQWDAALELLDAAAPDGVEAAIGKAEVLLDRDLWTGGHDADHALDQLPTEDSWQVRSLRARHEYTTQLRNLLAGGQPSPASVQQQLEQLLADAADGEPAALASLYLGLTAEVLNGDAATAARHYRDVVDHGDPYLTAFALRHLGGHAADAGDTDGAQELWWRSLRLRQRAGHLTGALAQILLLPPDTSGRDVTSSWADELGAHTLRGMATHSDTGETSPNDASDAAVGSSPGAVFLRLINGVSEGRLAELPGLYADQTDVRHPISTPAGAPLRSRSELRKHFNAAPDGSSAPPPRRPVNIVVHETADPEVVVGEFAYEVTGVDGGAFHVPCVFVIRAHNGEIVESRDYIDPIRSAKARGSLGDLVTAIEQMQADLSR
jgi:uncharacterized protein